MEPGQQVDSRDVLDPDARTAVAFDAVVVGEWRRSGPNSWDPYEYVEVPAADTIRVAPGLEVQVEADEPLMRLRRQGKVVEIRWVPAEAHLAEMRSQGLTERTYLVTRLLEEFHNAPGLGVAAHVARQMGDSGSKME